MFRHFDRTGLPYRTLQRVHLMFIKCFLRSVLKSFYKMTNSQIRLFFVYPTLNKQTVKTVAAERRDVSQGAVKVTNINMRLNWQSDKLTSFIIWPEVSTQTCGRNLKPPQNILSSVWTSCCAAADPDRPMWVKSTSLTSDQCTRSTDTL